MAVGKLDHRPLGLTVALLNRTEELVLQAVRRAGRQQFKGVTEAGNGQCRAINGGAELLNDSLVGFMGRYGHSASLPGGTPVRPGDSLGV